MDKPKFCVDCEHHIASQHSKHGEFDKCGLTMKYNLVTGEKIYSFCDSQRIDMEGHCGSKAVFWHPIVDKSSPEVEPF